MLYAIMYQVLKKRTLVEKEKSIYAPMSGVGGIVYDKDAVYIDLGRDRVRRREMFQQGHPFSFVSYFVYIDHMTGTIAENPYSYPV